MIPATKDSRYLCIETSEEAGRRVVYIFRSVVEGMVRAWHEDLKWRIQAHHHIKYDWVESSVSGTEDSTDK